jgi:hypothetical protein
MASQGRSWNDHFCTEIGDKPLVANSFPSARLLKNGEVISLFFGSGSRDSNRVRGSEKRNPGIGEALLESRSIRRQTRTSPSWTRVPNADQGARAVLEAQLSTMELQKSVPGRPGMLIFDIGPLSNRTKKDVRVSRRSCKHSIGRSKRPLTWYPRDEQTIPELVPTLSPWTRVLAQY